MKKLLILMILFPLVCFGQARPHWLQIQGKPMLDVRDFGAKGDGATDDTAAFQAALDVGGEILIPEGTFVVSSPLIATKSIILRGVGWKQSIVNFTGTGKFLTLESGRPNQIRNFRLNSTLGQDDTNLNVGISGRLSASNRDMLIDAMYIDGFSYAGILVMSSYNNRITNSDIRNCGNATTQGAGIYYSDAGSWGTTISTGDLIENMYLASNYYGIFSHYTSWNGTYRNIISEYNTVGIKGRFSRAVMSMLYGEQNTKHLEISGSGTINTIVEISNTDPSTFGSGNWIYMDRYGMKVGDWEEPVFDVHRTDGLTVNGGFNKIQSNYRLIEPYASDTMDITIVDGCGILNVFAVRYGDSTRASAATIAYARTRNTDWATSTLVLTEGSWTGVPFDLTLDENDKIVVHNNSHWTVRFRVNRQGL